MSSIYRDGSRNGYRVQFYANGVRRKLWLGPVTKSQARAVAGHLEQLAIARSTGTMPPAETRRWAQTIGDRIRNRLAAWGLLDQTTTSADVPRTLGDFTQHYIDGRTDWQPRTRLRMANTRRRMIAELGADTAIARITSADAQRFARWCRQNITSHTHSGKTISDARQFFLAAISERLIAENPFKGVNCSQNHRKDREAYVDHATIQRLIAKSCPYYAALIAVARFGGLRMPSEPLQLEWTHIDWDLGRISVYAPKTKTTRSIPLFPELRQPLQHLHDIAPDGSRWIFDRYRSTAAKVYRAGLLRICTAAHVEPWPKIWMNLRASCRTDLLARFPTHVVDAWLGHDAKIGQKHYDRVTDQHYSDAVGSPVGSLGHIPPHPTASPTTTDQ